jgi:hypothetical protein
MFFMKIMICKKAKIRRFFDTKQLYSTARSYKWDYGENIFLFFFCLYNIQHCFICRPSDSTVPTDAGIEPRTQDRCNLCTGSQTL